MIGVMVRVRVARSSLLPAIFALCAMPFAAADAAARQASGADLLARATELSIPASPALALLDIDPSNIVRPGFAEQFKLDLLVRDEGLRPDLALALRPVWTFIFQDISAPQYRAVSPVLRMLSTATVSIGSRDDGDARSLAWSISLNVLRKDPLLDRAYVDSLSALLAVTERQQRIAERMATEEVRARREMAQATMEAALSEAERAQRTAEILGRLEETRSRFREEARAIEEGLTRDVQTFVREWRERHWNAAALDIGAGRLYEYAAPAGVDLDLMGAGTGAWVAAAHGLGTDRMLVSAMGRIMDIAGSTRTMLGANVRYGGARYDAFIEYLFRENGGEDLHEIAYGGTVRLDESRSIEFGLRTGYDQSMDLRQAIPIVKLDWLIGKRQIEDLVLDLRR